LFCFLLSLQDSLDLSLPKAEEMDCGWVGREGERGGEMMTEREQAACARKRAGGV